MLLVEAARIIMMRPHLWPNYSFGSWLAGAVTRMPGNKAAIALARKLARIARSLLRHGTSFDTAENRDMATRAICRPTAIIEFARESPTWNGLITPPESESPLGLRRPVRQWDQGACVTPSWPRPSRRSDRPDTYERLPQPRKIPDCEQQPAHRKGLFVSPHSFGRVMCRRFSGAPFRAFAEPSFATRRLLSGRFIARSLLSSGRHVRRCGLL